MQAAGVSRPGSPCTPTARRKIRPMKLYNANLSPYASRVRLAIYAKDLKVDVLPPPGGGLKSSEYLAINPLGKIPTLEIDGFRLPESEVILEYLEDRFPEPSLRPADLQARARVRLIGRISDLYIMEPLRQLFGQMNPATRDAKVVEAAVAGVESGVRHLSFYIDGPQAAVGTSLTIGDCTVVPALFFVEKIVPAFGRPDPMGVAPKVKAYWAGVQKHPVVARVVSEMEKALVERLKQGA